MLITEERYKKAIETQELAWQENGEPKDLSRKKCFHCNSKLKAKGKKPLVFPAGYNGACPLCGKELQESRCPG